MKGLKLRLSRTLILVIGGVLLVGGSGAAALYIGSDRLLGPSYESINGLECTTLQEMKLNRDQRTWVRRYVFTSGGDGPARLRTAVRVAKAVQKSAKADLIQITVLDKSGPTQRAAMRGRAIGAQVVYIPDTSKAPDPNDPVYSAFYIEGTASNGEFFGLRISPPVEDIEKIAAELTDGADCISPVVETEESGKSGSGEHGKTSGHESKTDEKKGKGDASEQGGGHDSPAADAGHGKAAPAEGHGGEAGTEDGKSEGLVSSISTMIFGKKSEAVAAQPPHPEAQGEEKMLADHQSPSPEHTAAAEPAGLVDRIKAMMFGKDKPEVVEKQPSPAPVGQGAAKPDAQASHDASHDGIDPMKVAAPTDASAKGSEKSGH
ncbi:hypothetical protein ACFSE1_15340 [Rhizobium helianthi]|uniref:Uncharacterized protein n=1 Tax=Rhizobium helianthi TaxID=1132695 RepID=A0ABW4M7B6_9HYPH